MSKLVTYNGIVYSVPSTGEINWGVSLTAYLVALASGSLTLQGGNFPLLADANIGPNFGIVSPYYKTTSANIAQSGQVRLSNSDSIEFRNAANTADIGITVGAGDGLYFNGNQIQTVNMPATQAVYADLAERYAADAYYAAGTVLSIGANEEVTLATGEKTTDVFGVVSTRPGFMMNSAAGDDETHPYIAMSGRVPVMAIGEVRKGQRLVVSNIPGVAIGLDEDELLSTSTLAIIGRALENKKSITLGMILTVVGAK